MVEFLNLETSRAEFIVDLYLTFNCNLNCEYCCSRVDKNIFSNQGSFKDFKYYIDQIAKTQYKTCLCILGGEPMLYKNLDNIITYAQKYKIFKDIELYTNGTILLQKLKNIDNYTNQFYVVLSIHPEQYFKYRNSIIGNINFLINNNINYRVKLMLENMPKFNINCADVYNDLIKNNKDTIIYPGYIENIEDDTFDIIPDTCPIDELKNQKTIQLGKTKISQYHFIKLFLNRNNKKRICYPNEVSVYPDGSISHLCIDTKLNGQSRYNLKEYHDYFKDFKIPRLECTKYCSYLEQRREF